MKILGLLFVSGRRICKMCLLLREEAVDFVMMLFIVNVCFKSIYILEISKNL